MRTYFVSHGKEVWRVKDCLESPFPQEYLSVVVISMLRHVFEKRNDKESERRVPKNGEEVQDSRNIIYRVNKYGTVCTMCVKQSFLQVDRGRSTRLQIADLAKSSKDGGLGVHTYM